ncbi:MAG: hypothetical protein QGG64_21180 [Candidatus Latescibacteria bacterium]|jgi:hypothetical protein|nr:hypothetical protein [Candidatus Latescibacterota bacterium]
MKNIVIIDGALNSRFEIYGVADDIFDQLFPSDIDEIYLEDLDDELQDDAPFWNRVYENEIDRQNVQGIHGILHTHPRAKVSIMESLS